MTLQMHDRQERWSHYQGRSTSWGFCALKGREKKPQQRVHPVSQVPGPDGAIRESERNAAPLTFPPPTHTHRGGGFRGFRRLLIQFLRGAPPTFQAKQWVGLRSATSTLFTCSQRSLPGYSGLVQVVDQVLIQGKSFCVKVRNKNSFQ